MRYNYDFEVASLLIMLIILMHFLLVRQFPLDKTKIFGMFLWASIAECAVNILSCLGLENAMVVPQLLNQALAFAFFLLEGLSSFLLFLYFLVVCEYRDRERRVAFLFGFVPFALFEVLALLTPFIRFFFYFEDGAYVQGYGANFGYAYIVYYFALDVILVVAKRRVVSARTKAIVASYTAIAIAMVVAQFFVRGVLLTSVGNAVVLVMLYLAMQNPSDMIDSVTGVGNESSFFLQMKNMLGHDARQVVLTVHLCKFYHIHAVFGMKNRDLILQDVGRYLCQVCGKFRVFRISGDTFIVIADSPERARVLRREILSRFEQEWEVQENHIVLSMNLLEQHYPDDFQSISEFLSMRQFLLERVAEDDQAVIEVTPELIEQFRRRMKVEMAMLRAIRERSFMVYYQPIYSIRERRIVSLEALVRLFDEELGFIPPDEFIPLAEQDGNIVHIGEQVLETCCSFLSRHVLSNPSLGIRTVHVNVAMAQCMRQNLTDAIIPSLERYHIPPSMITLEVTEGTAISAPEQMQKHMKDLGMLGVRFALDDYGSGNANCSYLIRFAFNEVKMDKDIVWASFEKESARIVLENEVKTIQQLGIPLVVEGIESQEQSDALERLGVDLVQGYFYGKPMPEEECLRHIRSYNAAPGSASQGSTAPGGAAQNR